MARFVYGNGTVNLKFVPCPIASNFTSYSRNFWRWIPVLYAHSAIRSRCGDSVPWRNGARPPKLR